MKRHGSLRRWLFGLARLTIGIGLLVYLVKSKIVDFHSLSRLVAVWPISLAAIVLLLLDLALMACRLCLLFRAQGMHFQWAESLQLTSVSSFFSTFLPGRAGGDLAKIFYASKGSSGRRTEIITILLFDRALGLFSLLLLPLLLVPLFPELLRTSVVRAALLVDTLLALAMMSGFVGCTLAPRRMADWADRRVLLRGSLPVRRFLETVAGYGRSPGMLSGALLISLADNLIGTGVLALGLFAVRPASVQAKLCVMVPLGQIVNSLPLTPGGLGVGETAFHALFGLAGMHGGADALLCWRIWNALVSLLGLFFYLRGIRTRILELPGNLAEISVER
ncbi:MAG TPA: lysylphosphatidylglycerol synthase transmembrane domain-containing protein [Acidobacteriaceae bacterium]|nr:lysylphosphatidylglycerol synthase transmembrane domain-containing protein [Acidobacteriaceae bacterium]